MASMLTNCWLGFRRSSTLPSWQTRTDDEFVSIEHRLLKEMERNRIGNLLAGARLKAGLTQAQLAERVGFART